MQPSIFCVRGLKFLQKPHRVRALAFKQKSVCCFCVEPSRNLSAASANRGLKNVDTGSRPVSQEARVPTLEASGSDIGAAALLF